MPKSDLQVWILRSRSEFASNPVLGPGLDWTSNLDLRSRSEFAPNPVLRSRTEFDVKSSPEIQGRAESDFGGNPRSRTEVESGSADPGLESPGLDPTSNPDLAPGPGLDLTPHPVLRSRAEPSPISAENPDPGLRSNLDLQIQVWNPNPVLDPGLNYTRNQSWISDPGLTSNSVLGNVSPGPAILDLDLRNSVTEPELVSSPPP